MTKPSRYTRRIFSYTDDIGRTIRCEEWKLVILKQCEGLAPISNDGVFSSIFESRSDDTYSKQELLTIYLNLGLKKKVAEYFVNDLEFSKPFIFQKF